MTDHASQHVFVVRIQHEPSREQPDHWRGSVEHIASGQRRYFTSLHELQEIISSRMDFLKIRSESG